MVEESWSALGHSKVGMGYTRDWHGSRGGNAIGYTVT